MNLSHLDLSVPTIFTSSLLHPPYSPSPAHADTLVERRLARSRASRRDPSPRSPHSLLARLANLARPLVALAAAYSPALPATNPTGWTEPPSQSTTTTTKRRRPPISSSKPSNLKRAPPESLACFFLPSHLSEPSLSPLLFNLLVPSFQSLSESQVSSSSSQGVAPPARPSDPPLSTRIARHGLS